MNAIPIQKCGLHRELLLQVMACIRHLPAIEFADLLNILAQEADRRWPPDADDDLTLGMNILADVISGTPETEHDDHAPCQHVPPVFSIDAAGRISLPTLAHARASAACSRGGLLPARRRKE